MLLLSIAKLVYHKKTFITKCDFDLKSEDLSDMHEKPSNSTLKFIEETDVP